MSSWIFIIFIILALTIFSGFPSSDVLIDVFLEDVVVVHAVGGLGTLHGSGVVAQTAKRKNAFSPAILQR